LRAVLWQQGSRRGSQCKALVLARLLKEGRAAVVTGQQFCAQQFGPLMWPGCFVAAAASRQVTNCKKTTS
jgi:hypothetical protein